MAVDIHRLHRRMRAQRRDGFHAMLLQLVRQGRTSLAEGLRIGFDVDEQD